MRIFLSSPADVAEERALARRLLRDELPYNPLLRGRVIFDVVSWDNPAAPTPMDAVITPQEAVSRFGPKPSDCDVLVLVLWSHLNTQLDVSAFRKPNGDRYITGTEWEFEDALNSVRRPTILVYRRREPPRAALTDPTLLDKIEQYKTVEQFFGRFSNPDGTIRKAWTSYDTPSNLRSAWQEISA